MSTLSMGIDFKIPAVKNPRKIEALAKGMEAHDWNVLDSINAFPPKSIDEILLLLEEGHTDSITIMDWIYLFDNKEEWDRSHAYADVARSSVKIFNAIS